MREGGGGVSITRISHLEVFLGKGVLEICSKFTGEHPCRSVISVKLQSSFIFEKQAFRKAMSLSQKTFKSNYRCILSYIFSWSLSACIQGTSLKKFLLKNPVFAKAYSAKVKMKESTRLNTRCWVFAKFREKSGEHNLTIQIN